MCSVADMEEQETSISIKEEEIVEECNEPDSERCSVAAMEEQETSISIKEEEIVEECNEPDSESCRLSAMDNKTTIWIKEEAADDVPEPGTTVLEDPLKIDELSLQVKQELELKVHTDGSEQKFLDDPLGVYWSTDHINEDSRPNLGWDENENTNAVVNTLLHSILEAESECCPPPLLLPKKELFPDDTLGISCPSDFIKEDPELNLEAEETENIVAASKSYASHSTRPTGNSAERCDISYEETVNQGEHNNKLEIDSDDSAPLAIFVEDREEEEEEHESLFATRLKSHLRENKPHNFSCSFCLQNFPSKYEIIMHVFLHIDGVDPPVFICKSCGEVFSNHVSLNKHLKVCEVDQALSADRSAKSDFSGELRSTSLQADEEECALQQIQFKDKYNTHLVTQKATTRDRHVNDGTSNTLGNENVQTVLHPARRRHKCNICGKSFTHLGSFKTHALIHAGAKPHKCDTCGKSFTQLRGLNRHALIHRGIRPHECDICGKSFTRLEYLKSHALMHTGTFPYKCDICGKCFTVLGNFNIHALVHTGIRPHKCDICGKCFAQKGNLNIHAIIHTGTKTHKCNICGKSFSFSCGLKSHVLIHTGTRHHKCNICGKSFTHLANLKMHARIHTGIKPHKCDVCGKSFTRRPHLKRHAIIHTGKRSHTCHICCKSFISVSYLKKHTIIHTGKHLHKCDICGKSFTLLVYLKKHALIHTGRKPHKCNICDKSFTYGSNLKVHALIHNGRKPHKCDICGKSFTQMGNLKRHARIHTGT